VLASGSGTILDAMVDAGVPVGLVVLDRPCGAAEIAARNGLRAQLVERASFGPSFDRDAYTAGLTDVLVDARIELVVMAGFGTVLGDPLYERFGGRVLNTHPSLLPSFPGWHAVAEALAYGVKVTGCTVHVAVREVDAGPILAQEAVMVEPDDTVDTLHERIKTVERRIYPATVLDIVDGRTVLPGEPPSSARTPDPQETNR
jgi:phosphoribosylglycinamide formyltransferase 1